MLCLDELCLFRSSLDDNSPRLRPSSVFLPDTRRGYGARGGGHFKLIQRCSSLQD